MQQNVRFLAMLDWCVQVASASAIGATEEILITTRWHVVIARVWMECKMKVKELKAILDTMNEDADIHAWDLDVDADFGFCINHVVIASNYVLLTRIPVDAGVRYTVWNPEKKIQETITVGEP